MKRRSAVAALAALVVLGCSGQKTATGDQAPIAAPVGEALTRESDAGPISATVSLTPAEPRIGDVLTLTLRVVAKPDVKVTMPPFGEALGRFTVLKYTPKKSRDAEGRDIHEQVYSLQAPGSGRQRIPQLRIEFSTADSDEERELLTEELPLEVESVVAATEISGELEGVPGTLDESPGIPVWVWPAAAAVLLVIGGWWWSSRRKRRIRDALAVQLGAYDHALERLATLAARGTPSEDEADSWYVELSSIVRRYLEDRQQLRAPELTTEEFLMRARHEGALGSGPKELLPDFLAQCDRVKFAAYRPTRDESERGLQLARQILEQQEAFLVGQADARAGGNA